MHHDAASLADCIRACSDCHETCLRTIRHCLERGGRHAHAGHLALLATCADICRTSADAMLRETPMHRHTCAACAEICSACAEECEALADDEAMRRCAEACRRCAESCRRMAA
jgi:hypothetical protein